MKEKIIINTIYFLASNLIIFLVYVFIINRKKKTYADAKKMTDVTYLTTKFKLDKRKTDYNTLKWYINFINPLIISTTFVVISNIKSFTMSLLVGFVVMLVLIYSLYEIIGRILKKKEFDKNG